MGRSLFDLAELTVLKRHGMILHDNREKGGRKEHPRQNIFA